jgi:hypothetical protein
MIRTAARFRRRRRDDVAAFLERLAATPAPHAGGRVGRLIFAMDATASRQPSWDQACHIQSQMFVETAKLGGLEIQLAFYRGFGEFHAAPWHRSADALLAEMRRVACVGGLTQLAKVLRHACNEAKNGKIDALVFVGDAFEEDIDRVCHIAGELGVLGIPVLTFRSAAQAATFAQDRLLTRGAYCHFDASSPQQLRDLLAAVAVFASGGRKALADYSRKASQPVRLLLEQLGPRG